MISFQITGDKELDRKFHDLGPAVERKILREALRPATKIIQAQAQANAPVLSGQMQRAIKVRAGKRKKDRVTMQVVAGKEFYQGDQFYAAFQEFGHRIGPRRLGDQRAEYPGVHFIERAYQAKAEEAKQDALQRIKEGIEREAASSLAW